MVPGGVLRPLELLVAHDAHSLGGVDDDRLVGGADERHDGEPVDEEDDEDDEGPDGLQEEEWHGDHALARLVEELDDDLEALEHDDDDDEEDALREKNTDVKLTRHTQENVARTVSTLTTIAA